MNEPKIVRQLIDALRGVGRRRSRPAPGLTEADAGVGPARTPREVLGLYHAAMAAKSADDLADLYAIDGVHEFAFYTPNQPSRYVGREAVRAAYHHGWDEHPLEVDSIDDVFVHEGADPEIIVGQWQLVGILRTTSRPVAITGLLVLQVRHGQVVHARDFVDGLGVASALGRLPFSSIAAAS